HDYVYALGGDDYVNGGDGSDEIFGGNGHDTLNGAAGFDTLDGGSGDDVLSGGANDDRLFGGSDNDLLRGGEGADWIEGGSGADVHYWGHGDAGQDNVYGFELGVDTLDFSDGFFSTAPGETLNDVLFAFEQGNDTQVLANTSWGGLQILGTFHDVNASDMQVRIDNGTILEVDTPFEGGPDGLVPEQLDPIDENPSSDELVTDRTESDGRDPGQELDVPQHEFVGISLIGTDDGDLMVGTEAAEVFFAGQGEDIVDGAAGDDRIFGGHDGDTLLGGEGDDFLSGGSGSDQLTGGDGADTFHFETAIGFVNIPGLDTIKDFEIGVDRFDFEDGFFAAQPGDALSDNLIALEGAGGAQLFADVDFWGLTQIAFVEGVDASTLQNLIDTEMLLG
ncbi:MAG: calcium-binding protein, partial [Pseudomonadota bacterium]